MTQSMDIPVLPREGASPAGEALSEAQLRERLRQLLTASSLSGAGERPTVDATAVGLVLHAGQDAGVLPADLDVELMGDLLATALRHEAGPVDVRAAAAVNAVWPLICPTHAALPDRTGSSLRAANLELRRSNGDLAAFAHIAAHDLSEPLRMVASFLDLLEARYREELDERAQRYIWFARDGALRMRQMIDALLSYAEIGSADLRLSAVDTAAVAARVLADLNPLLGQEGVTATVGTLPTVVADAGLLAQLLQNLVANAVKFRAPDRPAVVEVEAARRRSGWRFTVTDNGIGIPVEQAEKVFGMFTRLHPRSDYAGAGIGLALCRKIVDRHGGTITVGPAPSGTGTSVEFWLPDRDLPPEPAGPETSAGAR